MSSSKNEARVSLPFKVVIVGDQAVGKSSLVSRFAKGIFDPNQESTVGAAFYAKDVVVKGKGKRKVSTGGQMKGQEQKQDKIRIELWDTAGQERYRSLAPLYYRGANAAIIVFDITDDTSFRIAKSWANEVQEQLKKRSIMVLVGNKVDLDGRKVFKKEAQEYAREIGMKYFETSAKTNLNVTEVFDDIAANLLRLPTSTRSIIRIGEPAGSDRRGKCRC